MSLWKGNAQHGPWYLLSTQYQLLLLLLIIVVVIPSQISTESPLWIRHCCGYM